MVAAAWQTKSIDPRVRPLLSCLLGRTLGSILFVYFCQQTLRTQTMFLVF